MTLLPGGFISVGDLAVRLVTQATAARARPDGPPTNRACPAPVAGQAHDERGMA